MGSDHLPLIGGMSEPRARSGKEATGLSGCWKHSMRMLHREWDLFAEITSQKQKSKKSHTPIAARVPRPHPHSETH